MLHCIFAHKLFGFCAASTDTCKQACWLEKKIPLLQNEFCQVIRAGQRSITNILWFFISVESGWWTITEEGRSQWLHVFWRYCASRKVCQMSNNWRRIRYPQKHQVEAPKWLCHLHPLQITGFSKFSRLEFFFFLPGGNLLLAEGKMWQCFSMMSVGFNVLCDSHGFSKAPTSDCLVKTIRICSAASKMPIKEGSEKEERIW